ncbi:MAG TPA: peptidase S11 [Psychrobacter sp.]|uniref:D-alanyl-D-alanine endopeptidase n=1 Tax=Psychrobacter pasteurii TaxID=1945520 RepID=A0A1R4EIE4_9GAMM|nr:serine hydrolase [Psychrobacter pasteurii]SJM38233.1 D-alanyl-D-alanine endopeptidase precursor [Psychrobacter pasteurii]HAO59543.1 peptidase S11 [Psychrobacter sp.]HJH08364.1 serine hydrolase [Psychrobacter pasteurii]
MSINKSFNKSFIFVCIALGLGTVSSVSNAALTIVEPSKTGNTQVKWGNAGGLSEARSIMYSNPGVTSNSTTSFSTNNYSSSSSFVDRLPISTASRGVIVLDVETGQPLYEKNADVARPIASITKIMTAMVVLDAGLDMREEIMLEPEDFVGPKRASSRLKSGDRMNRAELLLMTLMKSENPAAKSLARNFPGGYDAFMRAMNAKARSLGMNSAFFGDPTGLDKRNVASPMDLTKMVQAAGQYEVIRRFSTTKNYDFFVANYSAGNRRYPANNTSKLVRSGTYPIGISKTGFINEAGRCVVMETQVNNRPAIIVILGADSSNTRWNDAENILHNLALRRTI